MSEHITHTPHVKRLERSSQGRMIAGVCSGLARYFDLNPAIFRLGLVVLTLLGGAGALVYIAAILVVPAEGEELSIAERVLAERRDQPVRLVALALVGVAIFALLAQGDGWPSTGAGWVLALVFGLAVLWAARGGRARKLVIAMTTTAALFVAAASVALVVAFAWFDVSLGDGVGDRAYAPESSAEVRGRYELGVGNLEIDLSRVSTAEELHVQASVGMGRLRIVVPQDASVIVDSYVKAGSIASLDRTDEGRNAHVVVGGGDKLYLETRVGAGRIEVERDG